MTGKLKKIAVVALATAGLIAGTSGPASAINNVPCGNSEFVSVDFHMSPDAVGNEYRSCFANAGTRDFFDPLAARAFWTTKISTGNNRVQWYGDGRWQPSNGIDKWTVMVWPNHPGGVRIEAIRIL